MSGKLLVKAVGPHSVPIHPKDHPVAGVNLTLLSPDDAPIEVQNSTEIRRCIRDGELIIVEEQAAVPAPSTMAETQPNMRAPRGDDLTSALDLSDTK